MKTELSSWPKYEHQFKEKEEKHFLVSNFREEFNLNNCFELFASKNLLFIGFHRHDGEMAQRKQIALFLFQMFLAFATNFDSVNKVN